MGREGVGAGEGRRRPERRADPTDLVQQGRGFVGHPRDEAQLRQGKERQRPLERRVAGVGQLEGSRQVRLGRPKPSGRGLDLAHEAVGGQADQRLGWRCGERQRLGRGGAGALGVAGRPVVARPGEPPVGAAEDAPAPGEPAVVRLQPGPRCRRIARVEAEVGREALEEEALPGG